MENLKTWIINTLDNGYRTPHQLARLAGVELREIEIAMDEIEAEEEAEIEAVAQAEAEAE